MITNKVEKKINVSLITSTSVLAQTGQSYMITNCHVKCCSLAMNAARIIMQGGMSKQFYESFTHHYNMKQISVERQLSRVVIKSHWVTSRPFEYQMRGLPPDTSWNLVSINGRKKDHGRNTVGLGLALALGPCFRVKVSNSCHYAAWYGDTRDNISFFPPVDGVSKFPCIWMMERK